MLPLESLTADTAMRLRGVLFDLDDTVLTHGVLTLGAYAALHALRESGLFRVGVTGRAARSTELLVGQWPVDSMVVENGALILRPEVVRGRVRVVIDDPVPSDVRSERMGQLVDLRSRVALRFPTLRAAGDVAMRITDTTWDIGEFTLAPTSLVEEAAAYVIEQGAGVMVSSVHMHASFDRVTKVDGARRALERIWDAPWDTVRRRVAYVGDSENDAPCFSAFAESFGVANLDASKVTTLPRYRANSSMGAGFSEVVGRILALRG